MARRWCRAGVLVMLSAAACQAPPPPANKVPAGSGAPVEQRQLGAWSGTGSTALDFMSEAGSFRIDWVTKNPKELDSSFQVTLRSSFSGRPLKMIVDHRGAGSGSVEFFDEPRLYEFLVASSGLEWSVTVVEIRAARQ